jgi:hypothetical protein
MVAFAQRSTCSLVYGSMFKHILLESREARHFPRLKQFSCKYAKYKVFFLSPVLTRKYFDKSWEKKLSPEAVFKETEVQRFNS